MHPIPAAKTALKTILAARGAWSAVTITDGGPVETEDRVMDGFWFNDTEIPEDGWSAIGGPLRRVTFALGFTIAVRRYGDDERTTEDAMWTLYEDLMAALKANPTLSDTIMTVDDVAGRQANGIDSPQQWGSMFTGTIACRSKPY